MTSRAPYHHGDLRNALIAAAAALAAEGGPEAVTVRAAARAVGVTPTAAYRHFAGHQELLQAAREEANNRLGQVMRKRLKTIGPVKDSIESVQSRLDAIGRGYIDFALAEPGLYRTAFGHTFETIEKTEEQLADPDFPYNMLNGLVEELVELGVIVQEDAAGLCMSAWALVHGLALLVIDGPFATMPDTERDAMVTDTLRVFRSLVWPRSGD